MITKEDIENQRELLQDDLLCILDGLDQEILANVCNAVVGHMNKLSWMAIDTYNTGR